MSDRRVMVIQMGARRNYVAARQLEAAGLLRSLVCDQAWAEGRVPALTRAVARRRPSLAGKIARRTVTGVDPSRIHASTLPTLATGLGGRLTSLERAYVLADEVHARLIPSRLVDEVDVIVSYFGNGGSLLDRAKARGKTIVTDFTNHPRFWERLNEERRRWPGWEHDPAADENRRIYEARYAHWVAVSDVYLCPSPSVADALASTPGFDPTRVRLTPYGASGFVTAPARTIPGRVLFGASTLSLVKGIAYLAEAATLLRERRTGIEIHLAGSVPEGWAEKPELADLHFLGQLDKRRMSEEFAEADLFCLPSLAEGSATVIYEAMANGVPVVTTASSGSVITDGVEGVIIPERDGSAIADAIESIVGDRNRRDAMSAAARATSERYSDERCGDRFVEVVREALARHRGRASPLLGNAVGGVHGAALETAR